MTEPRLRKAVCPGSFDPVTNGHLDVFERAAKQFDELTIAVFVNSSKHSMFTIDERVQLLREVTAHIPNIKVDSFTGLVVEFCKTHDIPVIVRGLRAVTDFEYELQLAQANYGLAEVETMFVSTSPAFGYLSSSLVKEIARHGGDVSGFVPADVLKAVLARVGEGQTE
jgi:pantetheine-phosphate adenylyltransferase